MSKTVVIALGGNAIMAGGSAGTAQEQIENVCATCRHIADMIEKGYQLVITHGNGPQVGNILIQNEEASSLVPPMPLDICGAQTQGMIGYMIQCCLANELRLRGLDRPVVTVVTQVVVRPDDPALHHPTKPVGPFYPVEKAQNLKKEKGYTLKEINHRGWRRVVPSPEPIRVYEGEALRNLVRNGMVVIACGGGGIPVCFDSRGLLQGVEAVIDKDLAGEKLAVEVGADFFVILTDVEKVAINFKKTNQRFLDRLTVAEARRYLEEGHFPPGTMGPKVEAAVRFIEEGGEMAVITSLEKAGEALDGEAGTVIEAGRPNQGLPTTPRGFLERPLAPTPR